MSKYMSYSQQLKDPRWRAIRRDVLERDEYTCQNCGDTDADATLHVHHKTYFKGHAAWEYPTDLLITYCARCHEEIEGVIADHVDDLTRTMREFYEPNQIKEIEIVVRRIPYSFYDYVVNWLERDAMAKELKEMEQLT